MELYEYMKIILDQLCPSILVTVRLSNNRKITLHERSFLPLLSKVGACLMT